MPRKNAKPPNHPPRTEHSHAYHQGYQDGWWAASTPDPQPTAAELAQMAADLAAPFDSRRARGVGGRR